MNSTPLDIAKEQVRTFWLAIGIKQSLVGRQYPISFRKLKQRIEKHLNISVLELEPLTSGRVERFLKENDLWDSQLLKTDPQNSDLAGALFAVADAGILFIRKNEALPTRKLFSFAHELGHYFVEMYLPYTRSGQGATVALFNRDAVGMVSRTADGALSEDSFKEYKANQFAAELLMPQDLVRDMFEKLRKRRKKGVPKELLTKHITTAFGVSNRAAEVRINNLDIACS